MSADSDRARLYSACVVIARRAAELSSWSRHIPRSIRIKVTRNSTGAAGVITAGGARAPMAYTFEQPPGQPGAGRHPVYARGPRKQGLSMRNLKTGRDYTSHGWTWVYQEPRRFMAPAADDRADAAARVFALSMDDHARLLGYREEHL